MRKGLKTYKTILKVAKYCIIYPIFVNLLLFGLKSRMTTERIQHSVFSDFCTIILQLAIRNIYVSKKLKKRQNLNWQVLNPAPIKTSEQLNGMHPILFCSFFVSHFYIYVKKLRLIIQYLKP